MEQKLREYAALLAQVGLNIQPGQTLIISSLWSVLILPACALRLPTMWAAAKW